MSMTKYPAVVLIDDLLYWRENKGRFSGIAASVPRHVTTPTGVYRGEAWNPARPSSWPLSWVGRAKIAWKVFKGEYDALDWSEHESREYLGDTKYLAPANN